MIHKFYWNIFFASSLRNCKKEYRTPMFSECCCCELRVTPATLYKIISAYIDIAVAFIGPPLWSSGQSSRLQIQRSGFDSLRYQIFWEVVGLPLSLVSTIEEPLERKRSCSGLENRDYDRRDPSRWLRRTQYPQKLALTSLTSGGHSVGIVRSRTQATGLVLVCIVYWPILNAYRLA
jgi:hypothetical protein